MGHEDLIWSVCLNANGQYALSGSRDNTMRLWDTTTGECLKKIKLGDFSDRGFSVSLNTNGHYALSGLETLKLWDLESGECLHTFEGRTNDQFSACLSADGRYALAGSLYGTLNLWDVATGRCLKSFQEQKTSVEGVCLSEDGEHAISSGSYGTLKLWNVGTGQCLRTFEGHTTPDTVNSLVDLSADGGYMLEKNSREKLKLWQIGDYVYTAPLVLSLVVSSDAALETENAFRELMHQVDTSLDRGDELTAMRYLRRARSLPGYERDSDVLTAWSRLCLWFRPVSLRGGWLLTTSKGQGSLQSGLPKQRLLVCAVRGLGRHYQTVGRSNWTMPTDVRGTCASATISLSEPGWAVCGVRRYGRDAQADGR